MLRIVSLVGHRTKAKSAKSHSAINELSILFLWFVLRLSLSLSHWQWFVGWLAAHPKFIKLSKVSCCHDFRFADFSLFSLFLNNFFLRWMNSFIACHLPLSHIHQILAGEVYTLRFPSNRFEEFACQPNRQRMCWLLISFILYSVTVNFALLNSTILSCELCVADDELVVFAINGNGQMGMVWVDMNTYLAQTHTPSANYELQFS